MGKGNKSKKKNKEKEKGLPKQATYEIPDQGRAILGDVKIHGLAEETREEVGECADEAFGDIPIDSQGLAEGMREIKPQADKVAQEVYGNDNQQLPPVFHCENVEYLLWSDGNLKHKELKNRLEGLIIPNHGEVVVPKSSSAGIRFNINRINKTFRTNLDNYSGEVNLGAKETEIILYSEASEFGKQIEQRGFNVLGITTSPGSRLVYASPRIMQELGTGYSIQEQVFGKFTEDMRRLREQKP